MGLTSGIGNLLRRMRGRAAEEDGSATIEVVLWLPFILAIFTLIVDATVIFHNHSNVLRIVQDANRGLSVGRYESEQEAEDQITNRLAGLSANVTADTDILGGVINTVVTIPASDMDIIGFWAGIRDITLTIRAQHFKEL